MKPITVPWLEGRLEAGEYAPLRVKRLNTTIGVKKSKAKENIAAGAEKAKDGGKGSGKRKAEDDLGN